MKIFFANRNSTTLADLDSAILLNVRDALLNFFPVEETNHPKTADVVLIQEDKTTFKNFKYIDSLLNDGFVCENLGKLFTINTDDSATGLLRGLYTSIPKNRFNPEYHRVVPYFEYPNPLVFTDKTIVDPIYLGGWRGSLKSNPLRRHLVDALQGKEEFFVKTSDSWFNHNEDELKSYVELIKKSKFSLCPAGWASATIRIYETMAMGRSPVIIADKFVPPAGPEWNDFALFFPENKLSDLPSFLQKHASYYEQLGSKAKENWEKHFEGEMLKKYYAEALLSLIKSTPYYTKEVEIRRWRSFSTYWQNKWSVPQRIMNKVKKNMKA